MLSLSIFDFTASGYLRANGSLEKGRFVSGELLLYPRHPATRLTLVVDEN
jgi:hypothetical protein